ncbi:Os07g0113000, partial [Oryza sativa Japonica Group]
EGLCCCDWLFLVYFTLLLRWTFCSSSCLVLLVVVGECWVRRLWVQITMGDTSIDKLFEGDDNSRLLARVSRLWEFTDCKDATKIYHIDLVLVDEKGGSIHAQIFPPLLQVFKPLLTEGKVYYLDSYRVKTSNKSYRPVANPLMMTFTKWTSVEQCLDVPFNFPTVVYTLTPLNEVSNFVDKNESFVDVIGFITEISTPTMLRPKSRDASSLKRIIQICDAK